MKLLFGLTKFDLKFTHHLVFLAFCEQKIVVSKHCKFLLLEFAFEQMNFKRVEFRADNDNLRSIAAMKSIGCTVEGVLRSNAVKSDGGRRDSIVLSILREEWLGNIKNMLGKKCE